ncbi:MAG: alpha/beta fold hydrolase [Candidatus Lokiarchaeota archaeon]|nr:alpha/beta fold hydrolase [Candidatus Lokiarchaeota archaeon]
MIKIPKFEIDDLKINYKVSGKGDLLVLIQGLGHKLTGWQLQVPFFRKRKMKVISYDNIGVGKSSRPDRPYSMKLFVKILKGLLKHLGVESKLHLVGISMGGMIAQHYALTYPDEVKTLSLLATTAKVDVKPLIDNIKMMKDFDEEKRMNSLLPVLFSRSFVKKIKQDPLLYEMLKDDFLTDPTRIIDYINQSKAIEKHDTVDQLSEIKVPTLLIVGTKDILLPKNHSKLLHEKIPNSRLEIIEGAGHALSIEVADKVNNLIWDFIKNNK